MRRLGFTAFSRYRPRVLTLVVLFAIAALISLANLSDDFRKRKFTGYVGLAPGPVQFDFDLREPEDADPSFVWNVSYGWPLLWRQHVVEGSYPVGARAADRSYSASRFAGNLAMWLLMLAAPAGVCEWLLRRYRPRLRWSLRTMLGAVGLAAACCAWYTSARERANEQDALIAVVEDDYTSVTGRIWVERWGPKWLDLVGADRFRRRIVAAEVSGGDIDEDRETLRLLGRLPQLQYLILEVDRLSPDVADALSDLRRLRLLCIHSRSRHDDDKKLSRDCLEAIGKMMQLEDLRLSGMAIEGESLACLAGLTKLKFLSLFDVTNAGGLDSVEPPLLRSLPALPRLEALELHGSDVGDNDLRYLALAPRLKSLGLVFTSVTDAGLAELASLEFLEELAAACGTMSPAGFESLQSLKSLKTLHVDSSHRPSILTAALALGDDCKVHVPKSELDRWLRARAALLRSNPGIVMDDGYDNPLGGRADRMIPSEYEPR